MEPSDKLKFHLAHRIGKRQLDIELLAAEIQPIATAFIANINKLVSMASIPIGLTHWMMLVGASQERACHKLGINPDEPRTGEETEKMNEVAIEAMESHQKHLRENEKFREVTWDISEKNLNILVDQERDKKVMEALESILGSTIIGSWTAFEALIQDLWITALNARKSIADDYAKPAPGYQEKSLKLSEIQAAFKEFGPEFPKKMGDVFCATEKAEFASFKAAGFTYKKAFGKHESSVFSDPNVQLFELVRNVLVHAGKVDRKFVVKRDEIKDLDRQEFQKLRVDDPIPIDGDIVRGFLDLSISSACSLIEFVNKVLQSAPA